VLGNAGPVAHFLDGQCFHWSLHLDTPLSREHGAWSIEQKTKSILTGFTGLSGLLCLNKFKAYIL
jgi:hypothetical protein